MTLLVKWLYHAALLAPLPLLMSEVQIWALLIPIGSTEHPIYVHCAEETLCAQARNATALKTLITLTSNTTHTNPQSSRGDIM